MKKLLLSLALCLPLSLSFAATPAQGDTSQTKAQTAKPCNCDKAKSEKSDSQNTVSKSWDWTKRTAKTVGDKTSDAFKTGWGWTKEHAIGIGRGFKEGGKTLYNNVTEPNKPSSSQPGDVKPQGGASTTDENKSSQ